MNPWHKIQKLDSTAGRHALGKHHSEFLFAKAEPENWRAMENRRQQLVPENQAPEETSRAPGPKVDQWGKGQSGNSATHNQCRELLNEWAH